MPTQDRLLHALESWAQRHPRPDAPVLHVASKRYTPREIVEAVREQTSTGAFFRKVMERTAEHQSIDKVIEVFEGRTAKTRA